MLTIQDILRPADQQDELTEWLCSEEGGFLGAKRLPDGTYAGVLQLAFTVAVCLGVSRNTVATKRFCFEHPITNCLYAYERITSIKDTPTGWVSSRPKAQEWDWSPITTAPLDGTVIQVASFSFGCCDWNRSAAYEHGEWIEMNSPREGQPLVGITHWLKE